MHWRFRHNGHIWYVILSAAGIPVNSFLLDLMMQTHLEAEDVLADIQFRIPE